MSLITIGLSHKTAPVKVREQLALTPDSLNCALNSFKQAFPGIECFILSTCNRFELYASTMNYPDALRWMSTFFKLDINQFEPYLYHYFGEIAIRHLMQVTSSLDSMILGEPQILGQVRQAYQVARSAATIGPGFEQLMPHVYAAAKAIRHETAIGRCPVSVAFSAMHLAQSKHQNIHNANILLIGAGQTIELFAKHLTKQKLNQHVHIANRTLTKAEAIAKTMQAHAHSLDSLEHLLKHADIVISATASPAPLISKAMMAQAIQHTPGKNILMIDIAMPRNIESNTNEIEGVQLFTLDNLNDNIEQSQLERQNAADTAKMMIEKYITQYYDHLKALDVANTIAQLRSKIKQQCDQELTKSLKSLDKGEDPEAILNHFAHNITQKLLHEPSVRLRDAKLNDDETLIAATRELFKLTD